MPSIFFSSARHQSLLDAAGDLPCAVIGDAVSPGKVDQATRGGYLAAIRIGAAEDPTSCAAQR